MIAFIAYLLTIPAANWMIGHVGTVCVPNGPCLIPVGFGLTAPSGVLMIGAALVLRDLVHRQLGRGWALAAIGAGAALSYAVAPAEIVVASFTTFLVSELLDFAVYVPLQRRGFLLAVIASSTVGAVVDSAVFLLLAFGSLDYLAGQVVGKLAMIGLAVAIMAAVRWRQRRAEARGPAAV